MTGTDPHGKRERTVFSRFVERAALTIDPTSVQRRSPPEPDILCRMADGGAIAFELTEVIDSDLAKGIYGKLRLQRQIRRQYQALSRGQRSLIASNFGNALINVCYDRALSYSKRLALIPAIFEELKQIPAASVRNHLPSPSSPLYGHVRKLMVARGVIGPLFDVEAFTWFDDPIVDRLRGKFGKSYGTPYPVELLLYYDLQPSAGRSELAEIASYVSQHRRTSPFRQVWILDLHWTEPPIGLC